MAYEEYNPTIWKNDPNTETPLNASNLNKIENELVKLDNGEVNINNSFQEYGIYGFGSYKTNSGSSHSSSLDRIYVNIPQGQKFVVSITTVPYKPNMGFQVWVLYGDGTSESIASISPKMSVCKNFIATKNIIEIGLYNGAPSEDLEVSFSVSEFNVFQETKNNDIRLNHLEKIYHELEVDVIGTVVFVPFNIISGHTYYVANRGGSGNTTLNTTSDGVTNLQSIGTVNAGSNTTFVASSDAIGILSDANTATTIYLLDEDAPFLGMNISCNDIIYPQTRTSGKYVYIENVNIKRGQKFTLSATLVSGSSSDVIMYGNDTNYTIGYLTYGVPATFVATQDIHRIFGYMRAFNSAVVQSSCLAWSQFSMLHDDVDNLDDRVTNLEEGVEYLPDYAETRTDNMISTLNTLQNSKSVSIGFITDVHVNGPTESDTTQNAMKISASVLNKIGNNVPLDFVMFNGDYLYNGSEQTKVQSVAEYQGLSKTINKLSVPCFIGKGNHDVNDIAPTENEYLTDEELYQVFLKHSDLNYHGDYGYLEKAYGYYDIPNKKIRCIFVNTVDNPFIIRDGSIVYTQQHAKCVSNEQLNFIADALKFDETGWGVVFFSHHALQNGTGINPSASSDNYLTPEHGGTQLLGIINAYRNKTTYSNNDSSGDFSFDIDVDYTNNKSDEVIALISGHTHADRTDVVNGIRMVATMASSFVYRSYDSEGNPVQRTAGTITETSWDVLTIDRINRTIYATRYGAGSDRTFTY